MEEYYFLFFLAMVWIVFASIQDVKKTEVANWLNFSLIAFALAYRAFYSVFYGDARFFAFGLMGFALFFLLANAFYYSRVFGGGDAKLLMGIGAVLPFEKAEDFLFISLEFIFLLFFIGMIYGLIYSLRPVFKNKEKFLKDMKKEAENYKEALILAAVFCIALIFFPMDNFLKYLILIFVLILSFLFVYLKTFEKNCLIILRKHDELMEGDWLIKDVKIGMKVVKKSVHGLSKEDIYLLKKYRKKVWVKLGIPLVPSFLIAFIMVFFLIFLRVRADELISLFLRA